MTDPFDDAYPICPECMRPHELDEGSTGMVWICDCGVTTIEDFAR